MPNFEVFDAVDFIAAITQHIPDKGVQMVRYYGYYSNKSRGMRAKAALANSPAGAVMRIATPKAQRKFSVLALGHDLALFSLHGAQVIVFRERKIGPVGDEEQGDGSLRVCERSGPCLPKNRATAALP